MFAVFQVLPSTHKFPRSSLTCVSRLLIRNRPGLGHGQNAISFLPSNFHFPLMGLAEYVRKEVSPCGAERVESLAAPLPPSAYLVLNSSIPPWGLNLYELNCIQHFRYFLGGGFAPPTSIITSSWLANGAKITDIAKKSSVLVCFQTWIKCRKTLSTNA